MAWEKIIHSWSTALVVSAVFGLLSFLVAISTMMYISLKYLINYFTGLHQKTSITLSIVRLHVPTRRWKLKCVFWAALAIVPVACAIVSYGLNLSQQQHVRPVILGVCIMDLVVSIISFLLLLVTCGYNTSTEVKFAVICGGIVMVICMVAFGLVLGHIYKCQKYLSISAVFGVAAGMLSLIFDIVRKTKPATLQYSIHDYSDFQQPTPPDTEL